MKQILFVISLVFLTNCHIDKNKTSEYGFPEMKYLVFHPLDMHEAIFKPTAIEVFDTLMLIYDPVESVNYTMINLNTLKPILSGINLGEGPEDILYGAFIDKMSNNRFQIVDNVNQKILLYSIDSIMKDKKFSPIKIKSFKDKNLLLQDELRILYAINDSTDIGMGAFQKGKFMYFQKDTTFYFGNYPVETEVNPHPFYLHQGVLHINTMRNCILYHSLLGCYYELYSMNDNKIKNVFSEYEPIIHVNDAITDETKHGICSADFLNDRIFLLYSGRINKKHPNDAFFSDNILSLDYDGNKKIHYKLDRSVLYMSVSEKDKRLYAIAKKLDTEELEIGYYKYD